MFSFCTASQHLRKFYLQIYIFGAISEIFVLRKFPATYGMCDMYGFSSTVQAKGFARIQGHEHRTSQPSTNHPTYCLQVLKTVHVGLLSLFDNCLSISSAASSDITAALVGAWGQGRNTQYTQPNRYGQQCSGRTHYTLQNYVFVVQQALTGTVIHKNVCT